MTTLALASSWLTVVGLIAVRFAIAGRLLVQRRQLAGLVAALELANERTAAYAREMERQALEDTLTGLHNRRYMNAELPRELERTRRFGRQLSLAILDIDDFKVINDRYSHQVGDRVLAELARLLRATCRSMDGIVRYGGDEFVLYFPETPPAAGRTTCQRLLARVRAHHWAGLEPGLRVSLSIGLASTRDAGNVEGLLEAADHRLRQAKQAGKNRLAAGPSLVRVA